MTCIVALVKEGNIWMAGDLMGSNGFTKKTYPDPKVFVNGDFVIGYTSSFRMGQILEYNWEQPPRMEGLTDRQYLQLDVIESMRACFSAFGYGDKVGLEDAGGNFVIGYKGCLYEMQDNFSILKHEDFVAVGSGQYHAEAALSLLTVGDTLPEDCLVSAIQTAARFTTSVSGECTIVTTDESYVPCNDTGDNNYPTEDEVRSMTHERLVSFVCDDDYDEKYPDGILQEDKPSLISEYDYYKQLAVDLGLKVPHNIGLEKLKQRIEEKQNE